MLASAFPIWTFEYVFVGRTVPNHQIRTTISRMRQKPIRYQEQRCLHFITFSCYRRMPLLDSVAARETFERELERVRRWYGCYITGYVLMPEHVHLLISEPQRSTLSVVIQMLKQITSRKLKPAGAPRFWQTRYYGFPVWSERKRLEKLRYIHRNPVKRGLVTRPEDWRWSSFLQWATGCQGTVEIECPSTAMKRETDGNGAESRENPLMIRCHSKGLT
jgi:putative transposase